MIENPYESPSPVADDRPAQFANDSRYHYKPLTTLLNWNRNLAVMSLAGAALIDLENVVLINSSIDVGLDDPLSAFSIFSLLFEIMHFAVVIAWNVCFAIATYRVAANAHALAEDPPYYAPSYAVGSYFIPFYNWVRPYQAMKECYDSCSMPRTWLLAGWWSIHLFAGFLSFIAIYAWRAVDRERVEIQAIDLANFAITLDLVNLPCLILLAILSHEVIKRLARKQVELAATQYAGETAPFILDSLGNPIAT